MKKKLLIVILSVLTLIVLTSTVVFGYFTYMNLSKMHGKVNTDSFFESKSETTVNNVTITTYEIKTANQLYAFSYLQNKGAFDETYNFEVTSDINMNSKAMSPIGNQQHPFMGEFNGNGHVISNTMIESGNRGSGFFGITSGITEITDGEDSHISNVHNFILENVNIRAYALTEDFDSILGTDRYIGFAFGVLNGKASSIGIRGGSLGCSGIAKTATSIIGKLNGGLSFEVAGDETSAGGTISGDTGIVNANEYNGATYTSNSSYQLGGEDSIFYLYTGSGATLNSVSNAINNLGTKKTNYYDTFYLANENNTYTQYSIADGSTDRDTDGYFTIDNGKDSTEMKINDINGSNINIFDYEFRLGGKSSNDGRYIKFQTRRDNAYIFFLANSNEPRDVGLYKESDVLSNGKLTFNVDYASSIFNIHSSSTSSANILTGFLFSIPTAGTYYIGSTNGGIDFCYIAVESAGTTDNGFVTPNTSKDVSAIDFIYDGVGLDSAGAFTNNFVSSRVKIALDLGEYTSTDGLERTITYVRTAIRFDITMPVNENISINVSGYGSVYINNEEISGS